MSMLARLENHVRAHCRFLLKGDPFDEVPPQLMYLNGSSLGHILNHATTLLQSDAPDDRLLL
jgi:hypothetical protein